MRLEENGKMISLHPLHISYK